MHTLKYVHDLHTYIRLQRTCMHGIHASRIVSFGLTIFCRGGAERHFQFKARGLGGRERAPFCKCTRYPEQTVLLEPGDADRGFNSSLPCGKEIEKGSASPFANDAPHENAGSIGAYTTINTCDKATMQERARASQTKWRQAEAGTSP